MLFHQDVVVATLASGSKGNCTYIGDDRRGVLVDCGLSTRQILERKQALGLGDARIEAVLITHEHNDHIGAARVLDDRLAKLHGERVPFYMTPGTDLGLPRVCRPQLRVPVRPHEPFAVGRMTVEAFTVPHDTREPVAYTVHAGGVRCGVVTDLGRSTRLVERMVSQLDICVLEFNHDEVMLMDGEYPWSLKQRVRGPHGHLSNRQAAEIVRAAASPRLRHLVLAHLSDDNNRPELAREAAEAALHAAGVSAHVHIAAQREAAGPFRVAPASHGAERARRSPARPAERGRPGSPVDAQVSLFAGLAGAPPSVAASTSGRATG